MNEITKIKDELVQLKNDYNSKVNELYNEYIDHIKNNITTFTIYNHDHKLLYEEVVTSNYIGNVQKALILSLMLHLTQESDHKTFSLVLKSYVDLSNEVIDKEEDSNLTLRNVFETINQRVRDIAHSQKRYTGDLIFSYKNGIQVEDVQNLVQRYGLYVSTPIILSLSATGLSFHEGQIFLNTNTLITANIYHLVQNEFKDNPELTTVSFLTRNRKFKFVFFRNTLDVEVLGDDGKSLGINKFTLEHVKSQPHENMNDALKNIEKIKEIIEVGFDSKTAPNILTSSYSIFLDGVYKKLSGKSNTGDAQIKSFMNITTDNG